MKQTAFTWRVRADEPEKLQSLYDYLDRAREVLEADKNAALAVSYFPTENLIRVITSTPDQPPLVQILICELEEIRREEGFAG